MERMHNLAHSKQRRASNFVAYWYSYMKKKIARGLNIDVFDIYGMTESGGVGTLGMDRKAHDDLHHLPGGLRLRQD